MKKHHLIILTSILFLILFYNENIGLNLGLFGLFLTFFTFIETPEKNKTKTFLALLVTCILSCVAFAWFGDFASFLAVASSLLVFNLKSKSKNLKSLFVIPVFITSICTFFCRFFDFPKWIPKTQTNGSTQKIVSIVLIPLFFVMVFFVIYTYGSDHFANLFTDVEFDINLFQVLGLLLLGFFIAFNFWNVVVEIIFYKGNQFLDNDFRTTKFQGKPLLGFLDIDAQRLSGLVTFSALNILLIFFIITYNYEQFYEIPKTTNQLSAETHDRVNTIIVSIVMAIMMILIYFKSYFNFDEKAKPLKISAKIWIILNVILVISAFAKNTEYLENMGLTYKKLGVYGFLLLSMIGLVITYIKISRKKTNAFLFNHMIWYFYGMILAASFINWGGIITSYNMKREDFAINFHLNGIDFSERKLLEYANSKNDEHLKQEVLKKIAEKQESSFLSKTLYYESLKNKK